MDKDEIITQHVVENAVDKNLLETCQQNTLAIHNLAKEVAFVKRNTSRMDDTYENE